MNNIPYIKKELRPIFDFAVILASKQDYEGWTIEKMQARNLTIECIEFAVKNMPPEVMDGCLNYVFTQLFRKVNDLRMIKVIIRSVLRHLFWTKPKYIRFERARGLLACMIEEYERRAWRRQRKVVRIIKGLIHNNSIWMSEYEGKKRMENGDLE